MKIAIAPGTRPEIIKTSAITRELERKNMDYITLNTGQHYTTSLSVLELMANKLRKSFWG